MAEEALSAIRTVTAFGGQDREKKRWEFNVLVEASAALS